MRAMLLALSRLEPLEACCRRVRSPTMPITSFRAMVCLVSPRVEPAGLPGEVLANLPRSALRPEKPCLLEPLRRPSYRPSLKPASASLVSYQRRPARAR
jgi:hypothetical protein